jgi:glycine/D-amino acid oxidase-like deaminating enzyme
MSETADIVVIGGGCMGTSIAWQLARQGAGRVVLLEKHGLAYGATGWTGAIVRTHYTHPVLVRMALHSLRVFELFPDVVGGPPVFTNTGFIALLGPSDVETVRANVAMQRAEGVEAHALTPAALKDLVPYMSLEGVGAAAWEPESGYADGKQTALSFADAARRAGVDLRVGVGGTRLLADEGGLRGVRTDDGVIATRTVIVAAGYRSRDLLATLGIALPLTAIRHDIALARRPAGFERPHPVVSDRVFGCFYRPAGPELTRIGTTSPHDGHPDSVVERHDPPSDSERDRLVGGYARRFPVGMTVGGAGFSCCYDCTPDMQPVLGPVAQVEGLHVAAGFSGHGFKLSPVVGGLIAERVLSGRTTLVDLDLFCPNRFAEGRLIGSDLAYSVATL